MVTLLISLTKSKRNIQKSHMFSMMNQKKKKKKLLSRKRHPKKSQVKRKKAQKKNHSSLMKNLAVMRVKEVKK